MIQVFFVAEYFRRKPFLLGDVLNVFIFKKFPVKENTGCYSSTMSCVTEV